MCMSPEYIVFCLHALNATTLTSKTSLVKVPHQKNPACISVPGPPALTNLDQHRCIIFWFAIKPQWLWKDAFVMCDQDILQFSQGQPMLFSRLWNTVVLCSSGTHYLLYHHWFLESRTQVKEIRLNLSCYFHFKVYWDISEESYGLRISPKCLVQFFRLSSQNSTLRSVVLKHFCVWIFSLIFFCLLQK